VHKNCTFLIEIARERQNVQSAGSRPQLISNFKSILSRFLSENPT
jgi:hypothetical protein